MRFPFLFVLTLGLPFLALADAGFVKTPVSIVQDFPCGDSVRLTCPFEEIRAHGVCSIHLREEGLERGYVVPLPGSSVYPIGRAFHVFGSLEKRTFTMKIETECTTDDETAHGPSDRAECFVVISQDIEGVLKCKGIELWIYRGEQVIHAWKLLESMPGSGAPAP